MMTVLLVGFTTQKLMKMVSSSSCL